MLDYCGKTFEEAKEWAVFVHPDDRARVIAHWSSTIEGGQPYDSARAAAIGRDSKRKATDFAEDGSGAGGSGKPSRKAAYGLATFDRNR